MVTPTVCIVLYMNESHSEVSTEEYNRMTDHGGSLSMMVDCVIEHDLPICISCQALDLVLLENKNVRVLDKLRTASSVSFLTGMYSHALPSFMPECFDMQMAEAAREFDRLGVSRASILMLPEFDIYSALFPSLHSIGVDTVLLQHGINELHLQQESINAPHTNFVKLKNANDVSTHGIVTHGGSVRDLYLKMLRGVVSVEAVIDDMICQASKTPNDPFLTFLIDLEAIQINDSLSVFVEFAEALDRYQREGKLQLASLGSPDIAKVISAHFEKPMLSPTATSHWYLGVRRKTKWKVRDDRHVDLLDALKEENFFLLSSYHRRLYLWLTNSDFYSLLRARAKSPTGDGVIAILPSTKNKYQFVIIKSDFCRLEEIQHGLATLTSRKGLLELHSYTSLSAASKQKVKLLHKCFGGQC
eukprot:TRINITY_DN57725_c0_g1_i2.p1 TRINITY_DN57725_c0_g1~~TRINITY_DN57725_c0_g1_i2.p1  ORF type:complete len:425 (-),score=29.68 TRINITY_DN57725_c0_g1_i2:1332-2579(-)